MVLESCQQHLDLRRGSYGSSPGVAGGGWRPYYGLDLDPSSEIFVLVLNPEGTRLVRSWRRLETGRALYDSAHTVELCRGR